MQTHWPSWASSPINRTSKASYSLSATTGRCTAGGINIAKRKPYSPTLLDRGRKHLSQCAHSRPSVLKKLHATEYDATPTDSDFIYDATHTDSNFSYDATHTDSDFIYEATHTDGDFIYDATHTDSDFSYDTTHTDRDFIYDATHTDGDFIYDATHADSDFCNNISADILLCRLSILQNFVCTWLMTVTLPMSSSLGSPMVITIFFSPAVPAYILAFCWYWQIPGCFIYLFE